MIDTSVWIDYFNGVQHPNTDFLHHALGQENIIVGDLILAEVLQGFRRQTDFDRALEALSRFPLVAIGGRQVAVSSAIYYRLLRSKGITIRKTMDCLIAACCLEHNFHLLHNDRDFDWFEKEFSLKVVHPA